MSALNWFGAADGTLLAVVVLAGLLVAWVLAWWRRIRGGLPPEERAWWRPAGLLLAVALLTGTLAGPLEYAGEERSLAAHMVQHLLVAFAVPGLILASLPETELHRLQATRAMAWLGRRWAPVLAGVVGVGSLWIIHVPAVLDTALATPPVTDIGHVLLVGVGLIMLWPLAGPSRLRGLSGLVYLAVTDLLIGVLGLLLLWFPQELYASFGGGSGPFGLSGRSDQALAGAILLVAAEPFLAVEVVLVFFRALQDDEASQVAAELGAVDE